MCLYDAAAIASAATVAPQPTPTAAAGIATLLGLKIAVPEASSTNQEGKASDLLALKHHGVQQPGEVEQKAGDETTVIQAEERTASGPKPMQQSATISSAPTKNQTIVQTGEEPAVTVQQQEEAAK